MYDKILEINKENSAIKFIYDRLKSKNYRGIHLVQHQRISYSELVGVLLAVYAVVGKNKMRIPKGDINKDSDVKDFPEFAKFTKLYISTFEKGSYNEFKKIYFVNLNRMGLIDRFDKENNIIDAGILSKKIDSISISKLGLQLLFSPKNSRSIFLNSLNIIFKDFFQNLSILLKMKK